jgi:hypothetical protein
MSMAALVREYPDPPSSAQSSGARIEVRNEEKFISYLGLL